MKTALSNILNKNRFWLQGQAGPSVLSCAGRSAGLIQRPLFYLIRLKALYMILIWNLSAIFLTYELFRF